MCSSQVAEETRPPIRRPARPSASATSTPTLTSTTFFGTQSPGDQWQVTLKSDNSFTATNLTTTPNDVYAGTYSTNPANGSLSFVVITHNGAAVTPNVTVTGSQISQTALVVVGPGTNPRPIVAFAQGFDSGSGFNAGLCSTVSKPHEWIRIPSHVFDANSDIAFGSTVTQTQGSPPTYSFTHQTFLLTGASAGTSSDSGLSCKNGVIGPPAGSTATLNVVIAASGAFVADIGSGAGGFAGIEAPTAPVDITTAAGLGGKHFIGVIYQNALPSSSTQLVGADPGTAPNQLTMGAFSAPTSATHGGEFNLIFTAQIGNGLVTGKLNGMAMAAVSSSIGGTSKSMILGISTAPNGRDPINFLLTEK